MIEHDSVASATTVSSAILGDSWPSFVFVFSVTTTTTVIIRTIVFQSTWNSLYCLIAAITLAFQHAQGQEGQLVLAHLMDVLDRWTLLLLFVAALGFHVQACVVALLS